MDRKWYRQRVTNTQFQLHPHITYRSRSNRSDIITERAATTPKAPNKTVQHGTPGLEGGSQAPLLPSPPSYTFRTNRTAEQLKHKSWKGGEKPSMWEDLFSAIVPDSSFARVRRVLVPHMEDEDDQENEKEDEREDGKQRVEESQATHNMSAWMGWNEVRDTPCSWPYVNVT